ncbi:MAG: DUF6515 family protein [Candidatus Omnitrophota bacterium]
MKKLIGSRILFLLIILSAFCSIQMKDSFAQPPRSREGHFQRPPMGPAYPGPRFYHNLPPGYQPLWIADMLYYYLGGVYYQETPSGYVVVQAPRGAVIPALPGPYKTIVYDNTDYYYYNSTYYIKQPTGYTVVTPPPSVVSSNAPAVEAPEKTVVVTVPNPNGSYIPVTLQKYTDGYVGPNGEFYPDYPTIDQLKAMYAKSSAVAERPEPAELTFEIPNKNGSITKVKITRTKEGYVGPEGEYYTKKPTIEQLKIMYAKN